MASFQAKIGWKWPRKRLKYKLSFRFVPTQCVIENFKQIAKKLKNLSKKSRGFFSSKNYSEMAKKETKIQIIVSFRSYPMRNRKFQKNRKKIQKIIKYYYGFI